MTSDSFLSQSSELGVLPAELVIPVEADSTLDIANRLLVDLVENDESERDSVCEPIAFPDPSLGGT
jgi:hypothetical protein